MNGVRVSQKSKNLIMRDLDDGDIAVVTEKGTHEGTVVHIMRDGVLEWAIIIGRYFDEKWTNIGSNELSVRRLEPGEVIEVL